MAEETKKTQIVTHILPEGREFIIQGKRVAIVSEYAYEKNMACPHCRSTAKPKYLTECAELPGEYIVDVLKCGEEECEGVYIVLAIPRNYFQQPIFLNWEYSGEGEKQNAEQKPATEAHT